MHDAEHSLRTTPIASPPSAESSTTSSTQRISSRQTSRSTTVSKTLLNGYVYIRPLLVLQGETPTPRSSTSRWPWSPVTWLESLACESINSWDDLKKAFIDNFQGSLHRVATRHALSMCKQEQGESIRSYVQLFFDTRATIPTSPTTTSSTTSKAALLSNLYTTISGAIAPKQ